MMAYSKHGSCRVMWFLVWFAYAMVAFSEEIPGTSEHTSKASISCGVFVNFQLRYTDIKHIFISLNYACLMCEIRTTTPSVVDLF